MTPGIFADQLDRSLEYFQRATKCLREEDSEFRPIERTMTVAQQVAHVARTVDWFFDGAFGTDGFDLDFEKHARDIEEVKSLANAREEIETSFAAGAAKLRSCSMEELTQTLPEGPIMAGAPRLAIADAIADHTAHHRGALAVYARLCGREPAMPYA